MGKKSEPKPSKESIKHCDCTGFKGNDQSAQYQDTRYGSGNRVHIFSKNGSPRCTICGKEK